MSFRSARHDYERRADFIKGKNLITHSAGSMVLRDTEPLSILAIAPVLPDAPVSLVSKSTQIMKNELGEGRRSRQTALLAARLGMSSANELLRHSYQNFGAIADISRFNAIEQGSHHAASGTPATLVFMENDEFFNPRARSFQRHLARAALELEILAVEGHHCDFAKNPGLVLGKIAAAELIEYTNSSLHPVESLPQSLAPALA